MTVLLKDALQAIWNDWQHDLPAKWHDLVGSATLGVASVDSTLELEFWEPIFPVRKNQHFPGMPAGTHALRAYDGVEPDQVRCVILGQDPYPEPGYATGRAFEAGNVYRWSELNKMFSKSIRTYTQLLVAARTGDQSYARSFNDWPRTQNDLETGEIDFESPAAIADRHGKEGVLLLNAALTLSRFSVNPDPHQTQGHLPFWAPLLQATLETLVIRDLPAVFIAFGDAAIDAFAHASLIEGHTGQTATILRPHPAFAEELLSLPNPFKLCNSYLEAMDQQPIAW